MCVRGLPASTVLIEEATRQIKATLEQFAIGSLSATCEFIPLAASGAAVRLANVQFEFVPDGEGGLKCCRPGKTKALARIVPGEDMLVMANEVQAAHRKESAYTEQKGIGYPRLCILGIVSDPWLFRIVTKTDLLESARAVDFVAVEFTNQVGGTRFFDLRAGVPSCDTARFVCR
jgi:hypothetical protein